MQDTGEEGDGEGNQGPALSSTALMHDDDQRARFARLFQPAKRLGNRIRKTVTSSSSSSSSSRPAASAKNLSVPSPAHDQPETVDCLRSKFLAVPGTSSLTLSPSPNQSQTSIASDLPAYEDVHPHPVSDTIGTTNTESGRLREWESAGWGLLKQTLHVVQIASVAFPPLQIAVVGLLNVIQNIENVNDNNADFSGMARKLDGLVSILKRYQDRHSDLPSTVSFRLEGLASAINLQRLYVEGKIQRGVVQRVLQASDDEQDVVRAFRTITDLVDLFVMETTLNTDINVEEIRKNVSKLARDSALDKLRRVPDAAFNSGDREGCMEGTRVAILQPLLAWATDEAGHHVYWLNGMAGTGKTAIACSLCQLLHQNGILGASFFCSQSAKRGDIRRIIPTVAWSLARSSLPYCLGLVKALDKDPDAETRSLSEQFVKLIVEPVQAAGRESMKPIKVIVVDALDECEDSDATRKLLEIILEHATTLPIKFFISSRPEPQIRNLFFRANPRLHSVLKLHDVENDIVRGDIRLYLTTKLGEIAKRRGDFDVLGKDWPPQTQIETLVDRAGTLFIYAFTAYKYISGPTADPQKRLLSLLNSKVTSKLATALIDNTYGLILRQAFSQLEEDEVCDSKRVLAAIICVREPLSVQDLGTLLGISPNSIKIALASLHSLVQVASADSGAYISIFHASFADYMTDPKRSGTELWFVDVAATNLDLARRSLGVMNDELFFNVTQLRTSHLNNTNPAQNLKIPPAHVTYACQFWPDHFVAASSPQELLDKVEDVLQHKFLFWLEVLSVIGKVSSTSTLLMKVATSRIEIAQVTPSLAELIADANEFVIAFREPISHSAPHIYLSALPFWRRDSAVSKTFCPQFPSVISVETSVSGEKRYPILMLEGHENDVRSVAFSPDSKRIASGSYDLTIRIWDAETGEAVSKPLEGHARDVQSISFSPDGRRIVSGSDDLTIRVWDADTGNVVLKPMEGHTHYIQAVTYSPDGKRIVSGSSDCTIRIWDAETGAALCSPLTGHTGWVQCVAVSHDGRLIASGSNDCTIRIWGAKTGEAVSEPLVGHKGWISSVAFSPDGKRLASGSGDHTIRIWSVERREIVMKPFEGHSSWIYSVAFSPDGRRIVSSSGDHTVRVWDAHSGGGQLIRLEGHTDWVYSASFSPDGKRIVSSSADNTIRVWDADADADEPAPDSLEAAHPHWFLSIAISPDGESIASGSADRTIRIWDAVTGEMKSRPLTGHSHSVYSVAFSPDGKRIVSGSADNTIRIWDQYSTDAVSKVLKGHSDSVNSALFSPDGKRIFSCSDDLTIRFWDAETGEEVLEAIRGHTDRIYSIALSPNGKLIVSGSADLTIKVWDANTGEAMFKVIEGHTDRIYSVAFSPDGKHVASGSADRTIGVWDVETGQAVFEPMKGHVKLIRSVSFSPDGRHIVSGSGDRTVLIWDTQTGKQACRPLEGHTNWTYSVAFSPVGKRIVSASLDHTIRVWEGDVDELKRVGGYPERDEARPADDTQYTRIAFSSNPEHAFPIHDEVLADMDDIGSRSLFRSWNGWIMGPRDELLFWVPLQNRPGLWWPGTRAVIGSPTTHLDLRRFVHGASWTECNSMASTEVSTLNRHGSPSNGGQVKGESAQESPESTNHTTHGLE